MIDKKSVRLGVAREARRIVQRVRSALATDPLNRPALALALLECCAVHADLPDDVEASLEELRKKDREAARREETRGSRKPGGSVSREISNLAATLDRARSDMYRGLTQRRKS